MACVVVESGFTSDAERVKATVIDRGQYAVLQHIGPYEGLPDAWIKMFTQELPNLKMRDCGAPFELYVNSPADTKPEDLITELQCL